MFEILKFLTFTMIENDFRIFKPFLMFNILTERFELMTYYSFIIIKIYSETISKFYGYKPEISVQHICMSVRPLKPCIQSAVAILKNYILSFNPSRNLLQRKHTSVIVMIPQRMIVKTKSYL